MSFQKANEINKSRKKFYSTYVSELLNYQPVISEIELIPLKKKLPQVGDRSLKLISFT